MSGRFLILAIFAGVGFYFHHGRPARAGRTEPFPQPTQQELVADSPNRSVVSLVPAAAATKEQAKAWIKPDGSHCAQAWNDAVRELPAGTRFETFQVDGQQGIFVWYGIRALDAQGRMNAQIIQVGERKNGQKAK